MPPEPTRTDPVLLTAQQVADSLSVTREFVYRLCAAGELESVVLGGKRARRIFARSVEAYIARQPADGMSA